MAQVYLNGNILPDNQAHISIYDRGLLFADAIYEAIPFVGDQLFSGKQHLDRLANNLQRLDINYPIDYQAWQTIAANIVAANSNQKPYAGLYIQITRGADCHRQHAINQQLSPTVLAYGTASPSLPNNIHTHGAKAIILPDERRHDCSIKTTGLLPNIMGIKKAKQANAIEAILVYNNRIQEATSSNIFMVKDGHIYTPKLCGHILPGVTRAIIIELLQSINIPISCQNISQADLLAADEVWLSSSIKQILPITQIDDHTIGTGKPGKYWQAIHHAYQNLMASHPFDATITAKTI